MTWIGWNMPRHYNHAPIVEAIIDLRTAWPQALSQDTIASFAESVKDQFPIVNDITRVSMDFRGNEQGVGEFNSQQDKVGLRLASDRGDRVLQLQPTVFTYSHLPPYSDWVTFRDEARPLWLSYAKMTQGSLVTRLAVRVINKLRLPVSIADLPRYSNLLACLPRGIPSTPEGFFTQMQLNGSAWASNCQVLLNAGALPQPDGKVELLLDFDIFVNAPHASDSPQLWEILDKLSTAKDDLFEGCITEETRELIA